MEKGPGDIQDDEAWNQEAYRERIRGICAIFWRIPVEIPAENPTGGRREIRSLFEWRMNCMLLL
jgi:hypothetical protein